MKIKSINPATEKVNRIFTAHTYSQSVKEIKKTRKVYEKWRETRFGERARLMKNLAKVLRKRKRELGKLATIEMGKPFESGVSEIGKCAWNCDHYAENAEKYLKKEVIKTESKKSYVRFDPIGIVLAIMPWNFPFWQVIRCAAPTLMAGNVMILKHSSNVPLCALALEKVFLEAGFPRNVFKTLLIDSKTVGKIIENDLVDAISLTGSVAAGSKVGELAGRNIKKVVLELGGSDPFIVLKDADIKFTCEIGVLARMLNAGQSCIAAKRFIVVKDVVKEFEEKYVNAMKTLKIGDTMKKSTNTGPLAKKEFVDGIDAQVKDAKKKGAKILIGGKRTSVNGKGYFYEPTVITNTKKNMRVYTEEVFGPVASIMVVKDEKEAIKVANDTEFGLGASIWTRNIKKAEELAEKIEAGNISINGLVRSDPRLPFGGIKKSGIGRELGEYGIKEFVNIKTIHVK